MNATPRPLAKLVLVPLLACCVEAASTSPARPPAPREATAAAPFDHQHAAWTKVLAAHVRGDLFDYAALAKDRAGLDGYLAGLEAVTPEELSGWTREERYAFWINAYNAYTIRRVIDDYPLESIRDLDKAFGLSSVFDSEFIPMEALHPKGENEELSLNDIEHEILRAKFQDARVHAAINCASASCPPLRAEAFVAERLDDQLDEQMKAFVRDPQRNRLKRDEGVIRISEIFKWFDEDFERDAGSVKKFIARYAPAEEKDFVLEAKVKYLDYSWALNDVERS